MNLKIYNLFAYTHVNHEIASIYILFYYKITDVLVKTKMYITKHRYAKVVKWISEVWAELYGAFGGDGDDWDSQVEALLDSESDIEENEV